MALLTIEICNNRQEAEARARIIKSVDPTANWVTKIAEDIDFVFAFLVPNLGADPTALPPIFTPDTGAPSAPAAVLIVWTED